MSSVSELAGELTNLLNIIEGTQSHITEAGESLQSARGLAAGVNQEAGSVTLGEILGIMDGAQEDMEGIHQTLSGVNERVQAYIAVLHS